MNSKELRIIASIGVAAVAAVSCGSAAAEIPSPTPTPQPLTDGIQDYRHDKGIFTIIRLADQDTKFLVSANNPPIDYPKAVLYMREKGCNITAVEDVKAGEVLTVSNPTCLPIK